MANVKGIIKNGGENSVDKQSMYMSKSITTVTDLAIDHQLTKVETISYPNDEEMRMKVLENFVFKPVKQKKIGI